MPKVSVIIPVYNVELYLRECLESVVNQTLYDIEIICVNDGSTDGSLAILEEYAEKDNRIKIVSQKNSGAGVARNLGLDLVVGDFVYFLDGDDYLIKDFFEIVVKKAENLNADIIVFDFYKIDNKTKELEYRNGLNRKQLPFEKEWFNYKDVPGNILRIVNPTPWNKLYKTSYIKKTGLKYLALSSTNDITFASLSVAMAEKIGYIPKGFLYYRVNLNSSITSAKQKKLDNVIVAVMSTKEQALQLEYSNKITNSIKSFMIDNLVFALNNYAGKRNSKYYRDYYKKLYRIFNEAFFDDVTVESIGNKLIFDNFMAIKNQSYLKLYFKSILYGENNKALSNVARFLKSNENTVYLYKFLVNLRDEGIKIALQKTYRFIFKQKEKKNINKKKISSNTIEQTGKNIDKNFFLIKSCVTKQKRNTKIIVSMTSYPARIDKIVPSIKSLLEQSFQPDMIVLWLAEEQFVAKEKDLPEDLVQLKKHGLMIDWCSDIKSYKKLIPALKKYPDDIIITVDDDLLYDEFMIEKLYFSYKDNKNAISCMRAHLMQFDSQGNLLPYDSWIKENSDFIGVPRMDLFATTGAGTLFPPHILHEEVFNEDIFMKECLNADDVWVKVISMFNNTPTVLVEKQKNLKYTPKTQEQCLWHENIKNGGNDKQLKALLKRYNCISSGNTLIDRMNQK